MNGKYFGILCAILSAVSYGLNPLFALPLYSEGLSTYSVLFYRFAFTSVLMSTFMLITRRSFRLPIRCLGQTMIAGLVMASSCLFFYLSFHLMDAGIASTLLFLYPVMVAIIMTVIFHEKLTKSTIVGILLALTGVVILCQPSGGKGLSLVGLTFMILSALMYAVYLVGIKQSRLRDLPPETLTFYVVLFAIPIMLIPLRGGLDLQMIPTLHALGNAFGMAFFPSFISFLLIAVAIKHIGPTKTSIIGSLEPLTGVCVGVGVFHEPLTIRLVLGIIAILTAVMVVILRSEKK